MSHYLAAIKDMFRPRASLSWIMIVFMAWTLIVEGIVVTLNIHPHRTVLTFALMYLPPIIVWITSISLCTASLYASRHLRTGIRIISWRTLSLWGSRIGVVCGLLIASYCLYLLLERFLELPL